LDAFGAGKVFAIDDVEHSQTRCCGRGMNFG
jgi:hypothetical protein